MSGSMRAGPAFYPDRRSRTRLPLSLSPPHCSSPADEVMPNVAMISAYPPASAAAGISYSWPAAPFPSGCRSTRSAHSWRKRHSVPEGATHVSEVRRERRGQPDEACAARRAHGTARLHSRYATASVNHDSADRGRVAQAPVNRGRAAHGRADCRRKRGAASDRAAHQEALPYGISNDRSAAKERHAVAGRGDSSLPFASTRYAFVTSARELVRDGEAARDGKARAAESNTRSHRDIESTRCDPRFVDIHETTRASLSTGGFLSDIVLALRPFLPIGG